MWKEKETIEIVPVLGYTISAYKEKYFGGIAAW